MSLEETVVRAAGCGMGLLFFTSVGAIVSVPCFYSAFNGQGTGRKIIDFCVGGAVALASLGADCMIYYIALGNYIGR